MKKEFTVEEAVKLLKECYITDSVQTVRGWLRNGELKGTCTSKRQDGYRVSRDDLVEFIDSKQPGILDLLVAYKEKVERTMIEAKELTEISDVSEVKLCERESLSEDMVSLLNVSNEEDDNGILEEAGIEDNQNNNDFALKFEELSSSILALVDTLLNENISKFRDELIEMINQVNLHEVQMNNTSCIRGNEKRCSEKYCNFTLKQLEDYFINKWADANGGMKKAYLNLDKGVVRNLARDAHSLLYDTNNYFREFERIEKNMMKIVFEGPLGKEEIINTESYTKVLNEYYRKMIVPKMKMLVDEEMNSKNQLSNNTEINVVKGQLNLF